MVDSVTSLRGKLTKRFVAEIASPASGAAFAWDVELPGFGVRTTSKGVKTFILQRRIDGREHRISIGRSPVVAPESARRVAESIIGDIARGTNPVAERIKRIARKRKDDSERVNTLRRLLELYCDYLDRQGAISAGAVRKDIARELFNKHPKVVAQSAAAITVGTLSEVVRKLSLKGKTRIIGKLRAYLSAAYNLAISAESNAEAPQELVAFNLQSNPAARLKAPRVTVRHRVLSDKEMKMVLRSLRYADNPASKLVYGGLLLAGQRPTQLARSTTDDLNIEGRRIVIFDRKGRRSEARVHVLPLVGETLRYFNELKMRSDALSTKLLYTATGKTSLTVSDASHVVDRLSNFMLKHGESAEKFNLSALRRTCETTLAGLGVNRDIRGQLLSHGLGGVQGQRYDRHDYWEEKRRAMLIWDRWISKQFLMTP